MLRKFAALAALTCSTIAIAPAAAPPASASPTLTIATGKVLSALGLPVAGAQVDLQMWPSNAVMEAAQEGDPVNLVTVASVGTDSSGDFQLQLPSVATLASGAAGDNIVDFTLTTSLPDGTTSHFAFSRRLVNTNILGLVIEAVVDPEMPQNAINTLISGLTQQVVVPLTGLLLGNGSLTGSTGAAPPESGVPDDLVPEEEFVPPAEESEIAPKSCSTTVKKDLGQRVTQLNAAGVGGGVATTDFVYTAGATSTLGVGYSATSPTKGWSVGGTATQDKSVSSSAEVSFPAKGNGYWHRKTNFRYKTFEITCWYGSTVGGAVYSRTHWEARPTNLVGGATSLAQSTLPDTPRDRCAPQEAGSSFSRESSVAIGWSNGVSMKGTVVGVDLSSRTGYSAKAKVVFKFQKNGWICGTHGDPGATPRTLVARKNRPAA